MQSDDTLTLHQPALAADASLVDKLLVPLFHLVFGVSSVSDNHVNVYLVAVTVLAPRWQRLSYLHWT